MFIRLLAIVAGLVLCASASAQFAPATTANVSQADKGRAERGSQQYLTPTLSGWYQQATDPYRQQCVVAIDNKPVTGYCLQRVSVLCAGVGTDGRGSKAQLVGVGQSNTPFIAPLTLNVYQAPLLAPVGTITIGELGPNATIGLNAPVQTWIQAVHLQGDELCPPVGGYGEFDVCQMIGC